MYIQRRNQCGDCQHQGDVCDIGTNGITDRHSRAAFDRGKGGDNHLGCRGAKTNNSQTDDQWRYAQVIRSGGGTTDKTVCTPDEQDKTSENGKTIDEHILNLY